MFLQKNLNSHPQKDVEVSNPLMQHYLKRKREDFEKQNEQIKEENVGENQGKHSQKRSKNQAYIISEHELSSMLFTPSSNIIDNINISDADIDLNSEGKVCCWSSKKRSLTNSNFTPDDNKIYTVPENSVQFKALSQYMKRNGLTTLNGVQYEAAMRFLYEKQHPTPIWINTMRDRMKEKNSKHDIFHSTSSILKYNSSLATSILDFSEAVNINKNFSDGTINNLDMHPHSNILSSLSKNHIVKLFQFGQDNFQLIDTLNTDTTAKSVYFHRSGSSLIVMKDITKSSFVQSFDLIDLETGKRSSLELVRPQRTDKSERYLKISNFSVYGVSSSSSHANSCDFFALGDSLSKGNILLFDTKQPLPMEVLFGGSSITSLSFSADCRYLISSHSNAQVKVWDIRQRKPLVVHWDDGSTDTTTVSVNNSTTDIQYSTGSSNGIVNVYSLNQVIQESGNQISKPKAKKSIQNLVTPITNLKYNSPQIGEHNLLAFSSNEEANAIRLANINNSYNVFSNFPSRTDYKRGKIVSDLSFSPKGEFLFLSDGDFISMYSFRS